MQDTSKYWANGSFWGWRNVENGSVIYLLEFLLYHLLYSALYSTEHLYILDAIYFSCIIVPMVSTFSVCSWQTCHVWNLVIFKFRISRSTLRSCPVFVLTVKTILQELKVELQSHFCCKFFFPTGEITSHFLSLCHLSARQEVKANLSNLQKVKLKSQRL